MALEGGEGSASRPGRSFPPGKTRCPLLQEAGGALGLGWTGVENLAPTGIRSPDRAAHNQSLYWLSYPAHFWIKKPTLDVHLHTTIYMLCKQWPIKEFLNMSMFLPTVEAWLSILQPVAIQWGVLASWNPPISVVWTMYCWLHKVIWIY